MTTQRDQRDQRDQRHQRLRQLLEYFEQDWRAGRVLWDFTTETKEYLASQLRELLTRPEALEGEQDLHAKRRRLIAHGAPRDTCPGCFAAIYDDAAAQGWCTDCIPPELEAAQRERDEARRELAGVYEHIAQAVQDEMAGKYYGVRGASLPDFIRNLAQEEQ